jgi:hypothetical protein
VLLSGNHLRPTAAIINPEISSALISKLSKHNNNFKHLNPQLALIGLQPAGLAESRLKP